MEKKTVEDIDVRGKTVLVRCDFNVPMQNGEIQDATRILAEIPTIKYLMEQGAKIVLCSHLGKPKPKEMTMEEMKSKYSLNPVAQRLSEELGTDVKFTDDLTGDNSKSMIEQLKEGEVLLLENTRFDSRETANDQTLSLELADLADVFVNDAFGSAHRAHSSTVGVAEEMDKQGKETATGFLMKEEVEELGAVLEKPEKPFVAILGGAKVSDKIGVITNLLGIVDTLIIGGKMANTFLVAKGYDIGDSGYEADKVELAKEIMKQAFDLGKEIVLPVDVRIAKISAGTELTPEIVNQAEGKTVNVKDGVPIGYQILDIGEQTLDRYAGALGDKYEGNSCKTIVWNGPLGYTESPEYARGTETIARYIAGTTTAKCVIGGGDSVAAVNKIKKEAEQNGEDISQFDNIYLSTGGGASLEFLEGKELPGVKCIQNKGERKRQEEKPEKTVTISEKAFRQLYESQNRNSLDGKPKGTNRDNAES